MSEKRIVYTRPDGGVSIIVPAPGFVAGFDTEAEALAACRAKDVPAGAADIAECEAADIPADRIFRDAWARDTGPSPGVIRHDMEKARAIHMDRIRPARDERLKALDVDFMRAQERGDDVGMRAIAARKQALRDIPQTFDLTGAATADELKALWPPELA